MSAIAPSEMANTAPDLEPRGSVEKADVCRGLGMTTCLDEGQETNTGQGDDNSHAFSSRMRLHAASIAALQQSCRN